MIFIDTNYFLRFLLKDGGVQQEAAKKLFREGAEGKIVLCSSILVFFEVYWVLSSFYRRRKEELVDVLGKILKMEFIDLEERAILHSALEIFAKGNIDDLEDAYNVAYARKRGVSEFKTFDKKLAKFFKS